MPKRKYYLKFNFIQLVKHNYGLLTTLIISILFIPLWMQVFYSKHDGIYTNWHYVWSDWAVHLTYANTFTRSINNWFITHPLVYGREFNYPFLTNLITGLLIKLNVDTVSAFIIPTILFNTLFLLLIYKLSYKCTKSWFASVITIIIFIFSGGFEFILLIRNQAFGIFNPGDLNEYIEIEQNGMYWMNNYTKHLIPQRSLLLGMTIGLVIINFLHKTFIDGKKIQKLQLVLASILPALLLVTHIHSFLVIVFVSFIYLIYSYRRFKDWSIFTILSAILCAITFNYFYLEGYLNSEQFLQLTSGWMYKTHNINMFIFWLLNWGPILTLVLFSVILNYKETLKAPLFISGILIFLTANFIQFQPYDWDNAKIFIWVYLFFAIFASKSLTKLISSKLKFVATILLFLTCVSGVFHIYLLTISKNISRIASTKDIQLANSLRSISNDDDTILTSQNHNHWVPMLSGRGIVVGYEGWLWTYGINTEEAITDVKLIYETKAKTQNLLNKYSIDYVVVGRLEKDQFNVNEDYFKQHFEIVLQDNENTVYKISKY